MSKTAVDLLRAVYRRIEAPEHFTTDAMARDEHGRVVPPRDPLAVCWCVLGAMHKERSDNRDYQRLSGYEIMRSILSSMEIESISAWSDNTPHAEVLAGLAKAIEMEKNQP